MMTTRDRRARRNAAPVGGREAIRPPGVDCSRRYPARPRGGTARSGASLGRMTVELIGDSARGERYAAVRLVVEGERIVEADAPGMARPLAA